MYSLCKIKSYFIRVANKLLSLIMLIAVIFVLVLSFREKDNWPLAIQQDEHITRRDISSNMVDMKVKKMNKVLYDDQSYHKHQVMLTNEPTAHSLNDAEGLSNILHYKPADASTMPKLNYIPLLKSPCFFVNGSINAVSNASVSLKCLPRIFILGFPKCGTTDLHFRLVQHQHLYPGISKEPMFWSSVEKKKSKTFEYYTCMFAYGADFIHNYCGLGTPQEEMTDQYLNHTARNCAYPKKCFLQSPQWNYCRGYLNSTNRSYDNTISKLNKTLQRIPSNHYMNDLCHKISFLDSSPNTIWSSKPNITDSQSYLDVPLAVQAVIPNARYLIIMRNPVKRLWSDFMYFSDILREPNGRSAAPEKFHELVMNSIAWWKNCTEVFKLPIIRCAYGMNYPENLSLPNALNERRQAGKLSIWNIRAADRLRIGIYYLYIKEWLSIIPREQFYFIRLEHYLENPLKSFEHGIFDFLDLDNLEYNRRNILLLWQTQDMVLNKSSQRKQKIEMLDKTKVILENFYRPYNAKLAELLKDKTFNWF